MPKLTEQLAGPLRQMQVTEIQSELYTHSVCVMQHWGFSHLFTFVYGMSHQRRCLDLLSATDLFTVESLEFRAPCVVRSSGERSL